MKVLLNILTLASFLITSVIGPMPQARADDLRLPAPGVMVNLSPAYEPVIIKGLTVHKNNPFVFDFIVDPGQDKLAGESLKKEGERLIKYFLASLAIPDKDLWVNLSPYEKDRIIPEALAQTDMGRDLLEQDYILKQITASLIDPEKKLGKVFWDKVYTKAQHLYGTTRVPVNTFNKVWIMADRAEIFERNQSVFVVGSHLKVMLEEDYLAKQKHMTARNDVDSQGANIVREIILPELEKEVNTGKNFANVRQIFNSIILAGWFKKNLKKALLNQVYSDKSKVKGIDLQDKTVMEQIYHRYLQAYKKGVFNYIKEDIVSGAVIPRKYFSGGIVPGKALDAKRTDAAALVNSLPKDRAMIIITTGFLRDFLEERRRGYEQVINAYIVSRLDVFFSNYVKRSRSPYTLVVTTFGPHGEVVDADIVNIEDIQGSSLRAITESFISLLPRKMGNKFNRFIKIIPPELFADLERNYSDRQEVARVLRITAGIEPKDWLKRIKSQIEKVKAQEKDEAMTARAKWVLAAVFSVALGWGLGQAIDIGAFDKIIQRYYAVHVDLHGQGLDPETGSPYVKVTIDNDKYTPLKLEVGLKLPVGVEFYRYIGKGNWIRIKINEPIPKNESVIIMAPTMEDFKTLLEKLGQRYNRMLWFEVKSG